MALLQYSHTPAPPGAGGRGRARASFFKMELEQGTKYEDFCFEELNRAPGGRRAAAAAGRVV